MGLNEIGQIYVLDARFAPSGPRTLMAWNETFQIVRGDCRFLPGRSIVLPDWFWNRGRGLRQYLGLSVRFWERKKNASGADVRDLK